MKYSTPQLLAEISDYWDKRKGSNVYKLIDSFNEPFGIFSKKANKVARWRALENAKHTTLDLFGKDISAYRTTSDDDTYRFFIRLMNLLSKAQGTIPDIVRITGDALEEDDPGLKIKQKGYRHISISIPFDYITNSEIQKFILGNMQRMLALGYWLDEIIFYVNLKIEGFVGAGQTDFTNENEKHSAVWWSGWSQKVPGTSYVGGSIMKTENYRLVAK